MSAADDRTLGVLLLGFAGLGPDQDHQQDMYLPALSAHSGFDVVGVADFPDSGTGERVAAKLGVPYESSWQDALAGTDADLVSVCSAMDLRVESVSAALRVGKDVLVDKPLALTAAECAQIAAVAAETGRVCVPAHHQRFHPMIGAAGAAIAAGRVGLPWNVQADFLVAGGTPSPAGELTNLALYPLDVIIAMTGQRVVQVHARTGQHWAAAAADDFALLFLTHQNSLISTISVGRLRELADTEPSGLALHRYRVSGSHGVLEVDATRPALSVRTAVSSSNRWNSAGTVGRLLDQLHAEVRTGRSTSPAVADALHVAQVLDAARVSATTGAPVDLPTGEPQEGSR